MGRSVIEWVKRDYGSSYRISILWAGMWFVLGMLMQFSTIINLDNGWLVYAAGRMVQGAVPYYDFYETNPPLILWLNYIPAWIAQHAGINPITSFHLFVFAAAAASLRITLQEIKNHPLLSSPAIGNFAFAALAQLVLGASVLIFGQREHLFILLAMPFLVQASAGAAEPRFSIRQLLVGMAAGLGFCIKPFYVLIWLAGELYGACAQRNALLLRRTNWIIGATCLGYIASVYLFAPHFIDIVAPQLLLTYTSFRAGGSGVLQQIALITLMYLGPLLLIRIDTAQRRFAGRIMACFFAACATAWIQNKGWLNHFFPAVFIGSFFLGSLLAFALCQLREKRFSLDLKHFALLYALVFITFLLPVYHLVATRPAALASWGYINQLRPYIEQNKAQQRPFMVLSFDLGDAFPAMDVLPVTYPFHFHHVWTLPGIISTGLDAPAMQSAKKFTIQTVSDDLLRFKPALVAVDNNTGMAAPFKDFDFIAFFGQDPAFSAEWKHYSKAGQVTTGNADPDRPSGNYTIYKRTVGDSQ